MISSNATPMAAATIQIRLTCISVLLDNSEIHDSPIGCFSWEEVRSIPRVGDRSAEPGAPRCVGGSWAGRVSEPLYQIGKRTSSPRVAGKAGFSGVCEVSWYPPYLSPKVHLLKGLSTAKYTP